MRTFFWGYFSLKWRRLLRTLTLLPLCLFSIILLVSPTDSSNFDNSLFFLVLILVVVPLLSYIIEPFVVKNKDVEVIDQYETTLNKVLNDIKVFITPTKQDEGPTDESISENIIKSNEPSLQTHIEPIKLKPVSFSPTTNIDNSNTDDNKSVNEINYNTMSDKKEQSSIRRFFRFDNEYLSGIDFLIRFLIVFIVCLLVYTIGILGMMKNYFLDGQKEYDNYMYLMIISVLPMLFLFVPLIPTLYKRSTSLGFSKLGSILITLYFLILPTITITLVGTDFEIREVLIVVINVPILFLIFVDGKKETNTIFNK